jgi:acyl-CoA ligase (AMP-forming) (exosortase A-associated)
MSAEPDPTPRPLDHLAERGAGDAPALVLRERVLSHKDLSSRVALLAGWLRAQVERPGARVASWAAKGELTCLLPLAAARASLIHVPINPLLKRTQVAHILADSGASMLVASEARMLTLEPGDVPTDCVLVEEPNVWRGAEFENSPLPPSSADPNALAAILYTSGSTGLPKGVMLSHANLWLGAVSVAYYLKLKADDVVLGVLPLSFDYGQNQLLSAWYAGAGVVPLDYLTPRDVIKACAKHHVTTLAAVPPLWLQLVESEWPPEAVASMRRLTNSGGALSAKLVRKLRTLFPQAELYPMYGLTEAFRSTYLDPELVDAHPTSMGKAIPFAEVMVIGDDGREAEPGEEGELVHAGPLVAQGYWHDAARTAERFKPAPADSTYGGMAVWSGDRVRRDAEGLLHFLGRRDGMIKSAGNRISPQEIEDVALASGLVTEAVALGIPDPKFGQRVVLAVSAQKADQSVRDTLEDELKRTLPNFMQPQEIRWFGALPLNPNGKIDRTALKRAFPADPAT